MEAPTWLKPAILGGIVGAIATVFLGFNQGGWILGGTAERMAAQRSLSAVTAALVPVCVGQSKTDPDAAAKLQELGALKTSYERRDFIMKTGWATIAAAESPNSDLADACAKMLASTNAT